MPCIKGFRMIPILKYFERKKISTNFDDRVLLLVTLAPQYGTSGSKFKNPSARIEPISMSIEKTQKQLNWMTGFLCDPVMFEKSPS
jgi:hypothetical protein